VPEALVQQLQQIFLWHVLESFTMVLIQPERPPVESAQANDIRQLCPGVNIMIIKYFRHKNLQKILSIWNQNATIIPKIIITLIFKNIANFNPKKWPTSPKIVIIH
jgi:hypothetical protein